MFNSLRYRLLLWFVLSTFMVSGLLFLLFYAHKSIKTNQLSVVENLQYFRYQLLKDQNEVSNFLSGDIYSESFYISGESEYLNAHYRLLSNIDSCFVNIASNNKRYYQQLKERLGLVRNAYTNYCTLLDSLVYSQYRRGFRNYGLEGKLKSCRSYLEKELGPDFSPLVQLKLTEKEYLLANDSSLLPLVGQICTDIQNQINDYPENINFVKQGLINTVVLYYAAFSDIVELDLKIGKHAPNGYSRQLNEAAEELEGSINQALQLANSHLVTYTTRLNLIFALTAFVLIALAFFMSIYTSRYLVYNLEQLNQYIASLSRNGFNKKALFDIRHSTIEIRQIYKAFRNMLAELSLREKQRNYALRVAEENQQRYQELCDMLPQCIYETDRLGNLTYVNEAWYKTFGYNKNDIANGLNILEIINTNPSGTIFGFSKVENNDFTARRNDGSTFPATVYSDVIRKGVRVIGRRGIIIDTSLRNKYIESLKNETIRAIASDKQKSSFLANMSHEIRTPMNSIIGFSNMLSSKDIPDELKKEFIQHIQTSSEMLLNLIDDIIDIAKIEAGQLKINKTECVPAKIIESLAVNFEAYKNRMEKEALEIKLKIPQETIAIRTDEFRLKQILSNLISNAVKFTEEGCIEIGFSIKPARTVEFYVKDTGIGMSKEDVKSVFDRFTRTKLSEEKKISGTGLGLAITKNLVELLGGQMWVTSEPGKGSCFSFEIPYIKVAETVNREENTEPETAYDWTGKTIIIAEDNDTNFIYLFHIIEPTKAQIIRASNGKEALEAVQFYPSVDLILMDLQMPLLNGIETTIRLKESYPKIPVIAQTAFAMEGDRERCLSAGADDYIAKPIDSRKLLLKMAQFINSNQLSLKCTETATGKTKTNMAFLQTGMDFTN
ncbi:MAG: response regulator [Bacteroidales bacterium]|nr:response regulator [Bacteroidales bacterium]